MDTSPQSPEGSNQDQGPPPMDQEYYEDLYQEQDQQHNPDQYSDLIQDQKPLEWDEEWEDQEPAIEPEPKPHPADDEVQIVKERLVIQMIRGFRLHPTRGPQLHVKCWVLNDATWVSLRRMLNNCPNVVRSYFDQAWPPQPLLLDEVSDQ